MSRKIWPIFVALSVLCSVETASAEDYDYHPALSDSFLFTLGAFSSSNNFKIAASGELNTTDQDVDFGTKAGVDDKNTIFNGQLVWRFGNEMKWALSGQYFRNSATGKKVLDEDVEWQGVTFRQGSSVGAGVKLEVSRVFVGRSLVKNAQNDFGIGAGLHILKIGAYLEGEILTEDDALAFRRKDASSTAPLPNVGTWYNYSPAKDWLIHGRVDWMSAKVGDYDGTLWNTSVGVDYQAFRNVGFDLSYQYFKLNVNVDKTDWQGGVDMSYSGPVLSVTANW